MTEGSEKGIAVEELTEQQKQNLDILHSKLDGILADVEEELKRSGLPVYVAGITFTGKESESFRAGLREGRYGCCCCNGGWPPYACPCRDCGESV